MRAVCVCVCMCVYIGTVYNTPPTSYLKYKSQGVEITLSFERAVVCNTLLQGLQRARNIIIRIYAHFGRPRGDFDAYIIIFYLL